MFKHSVKVPRNFKVAANIFKKVSTEGGSVKTLLYDNKLRHFNTNELFALLTETIKHAADLDKIFEECDLLKNEPRLDPYLAKILTTELLYGKKKLPGKSKPEQTILSYQDQLEKHKSEHQDVSKPEAVRRPRYVRINTNLLTTSDAIRAFQDEGYHFVRCTSGSYDDYLKQIQGLKEYDFTQDYHVKTMFVFSAGTKLHDHELYLENKIILQDKATALAVHLLAPPPGSVALDLCAAPGMKTTQLAAYMRNEGKIYAVERNEKRYQTLCDFVEKTGSKCVETLHKDSLEIRRGDYDDVEYILLDPSCSGSGMELSVHNYIDASRLAKLTSLQEKFLKHAMNAFPKAKRIVYSTCSLFPEENERVITNIVKSSRAKWRVQDVKELLKGQWNNFGSGMYGSIGSRCLYSKPDSDFTTGFFLAVIDRDPKDFEKGNAKVDENCDGLEVNYLTGKRKKEKSLSEDTDNAEDIAVNGNSIEPKSKRKKKKSESENDKVNKTLDQTDVNEIPKKKNKKKKDKEEVHDEIDKTNTESYTDETDSTKSKKKKKKDKQKEIDININGSEANIAENGDIAVEKPKKKKKNHKNNTNNHLSEMISDGIPTSNENMDGKKKINESIAEVDADSTNVVLDVPVKKKKKKNKNLDSC